MNRNFTRYISAILLLLFMGAFSVQSATFLNGTFKIELYALLYGKYAKTVHPATTQDMVNADNLCEKETEGESETRSNSKVSKQIFSQGMHTLSVKGFHSTQNNRVVWRFVHPPSYLITHTFRV